MAIIYLTPLMETCFPLFWFHTIATRTSTERDLSQTTLAEPLLAEYSYL